MSQTPAATPFGINPELARKFADTFAGEDQLGEVIDTIVGAVGSGIADLAEWVANVPLMVQKMVNQVVDIFNGVIVTPINNAIQGVIDWWNGLWGFRQETEERREETENTVNNQGVIIRGITDDLVGTAKIDDVPNNLPMWQSLSPLEDPSFPRYAIHTGQKNGAWYKPDINRMEIAFIRAPRTRTYNRVGCIVDNSVQAGGEMHLVVYRLQDDGSLTLLAQTGDVAATMTAARTEVRANLDDDIMAQAGEYLAVGILQIWTRSPDEAPRFLAGLESDTIAVPPGTYPPQINALTASGLTEAPDNITSGELDFTQRWIPWVCLGEAIPDQADRPLSYRDTFDRPDGPIGRNWAQRGRIVVRDRAAALADNALEGPNTAIWVYPLNTDDMQATAHVGLAAGSTDPSGIIVRADNQFARGMICHWKRSGSAYELSLATMEGPHRIQTIEPTRTQYPLQQGDLLQLRAIGDTYIVSVNGYEIIERRDTYPEVPVGPAHRFAGFQMWRRGGSRSPALLDWAVKDLNRELLQYPSETRYPSRITFPDEPTRDDDQED